MIRSVLLVSSGIACYSYDSDGAAVLHGQSCSTDDTERQEV
jgi:hypothetical protein